jgi:hypothetical protein
VAACTLWLAVEPFILPKMHERYFFPADVFSFVLAVWRPGRWWVAALFQAGSAMAYATVLTMSAGWASALHLVLTMRVSYAAVIPVTVAVISVGVLTWRIAKDGSVSRCHAAGKLVGGAGG